jgi:tetracycline 7-halogenase / FADH2 O2-dependent halogenase
MTRIDCDIAIVGSGFGGTLLALIARRLGYSAVLLERGTHPRFAIGESSTPLADFKLAAIADRFGLDWLRPFAKYGTWKATYPSVRCGLKRGFSFFRHVPGQPYTPNQANDNALMVAASPDDVHADTHWFRADFDAHLVGQAVEAGVAYLDQLEIRALRHERAWQLQGTQPSGEVEVNAGFLVDATGDGQLLGRTLGLESVAAADLHTRSRALYSHFTGVSRWHDVLQEAHGMSATEAHPFPCDAAALHQIIDGGWMWVLRFDHSVTSAGFSLDPDVHPIRSGESPEDEWRRLLGAYPSLAKQFASAETLRPFVRTGRLQRRLTRAAGADWALLPHAAGFLDAWLSPGIAQTLFAVERLGRILSEDWRGSKRTRSLANYNDTVLRELAWMDQITGSCFACFDRFEVMINVAMVYFVAAHYCEERERAGKAPADAAFLLADDVDYQRIGAAICGRAPATAAAEAASLAAEARRLLANFNLCNLFDPRRRNLYPFRSQTCDA